MQNRRKLSRKLFGSEQQRQFALNSRRRRWAAEKCRILMDRGIRSKEALVKALSKGQYIKHFLYGFGVITESDEERTSIDFDVHGMKKFVTSLMVVDPAEGTPPKRPRRKRSKKAVATVGAK